LQVEPVGQCNLRCQMCPIQFRRDGPPYGPPAFMGFETYTSLIDQFPALEHLHLQGLGEPLMHPRFFDMVRYAASRGTRVTTNTNLTLLNDRRAAECVESGLDHVYVSLDAASAPVYESIRLRSHYSRVIANIERLVQTKAATGAGPGVSLVMVLMRRNLHELADLVTLAADLGISALNVQQLCHDFGESTLPAHYAPMRDFVASEVLAHVSGDEVDSVFSEARFVAEQRGVLLRLPRLEGRTLPAGTPGSQRCDWPWTGAYVSYDGHAMPCCMISTPDRGSLGKIDEHPLIEIWDGNDYRAFREALSSERPPGVCAACAVYNGTF
jgi:MoaA/NifB/PqqE/SkfB family radical SAM enzyme